MAESWTVVVLTFFVLLFDQVHAEYCYEQYYSYYNGYQTRKIHCSFGCCGPSYDEYCCVSNAGIIVGIVFAAIFGIALLTAITCCFLKHKTSRGRVVRPGQGQQGHDRMQHGAHTNNVFIVPSGSGPPAYTSTAYYTAPFPGYGVSGFGPGVPQPPSYTQQQGGITPGPPAYGQPSMPPPAYSAFSPAYPPPPQPPPPTQGAGPSSSTGGLASFPPDALVYTGGRK